MAEVNTGGWQYRLVAVFGLLNLVALVALCFVPIHVGERLYSWPQAAGQMLLQALVAVALIYAGQQRLIGSDIGEKAYPAALVSYLLWACMMLRWATG